jgi:hypothetical protein
MIRNKPDFILEFTLIINQLGGKVIYPRVIKRYAPKVIVYFNLKNNNEYVNRIYLEVNEIDDETGVCLLSNLSKRKFVCLSRYVYLIITELEKIYSIEFRMQPRVAYYYFKGRKELQYSLN